MHLTAKIREDDTTNSIVQMEVLTALQLACELTLFFMPECNGFFL
jgi:hypothetical protein